MIRVLAAHYSTENELLLIRLFQTPHGFGNAFAPNIQRDIMLVMARWGITYWLSDQKNYMGSAHPWVRRAFIVGSYSLGDEGRYWRDANKALMNPFDLILRDWVVNRRQQDANWRVPI
jgi:hypothetical protein